LAEGRNTPLAIPPYELIPPETQIDLHRQTQEGAHRLLATFLAASQAREQRCVLVITGKGYG
jgi:DNA-nicking Smr family endonuclease